MVSTSSNIWRHAVGWFCGNAMIATAWNKKMHFLRDGGPLDCEAVYVWPLV